MIIDGTHPQLVAMLAELERRQALQLRWADRRHEWVTSCELYGIQDRAD
jgi:hypothetical protein